MSRKSRKARKKFVKLSKAFGYIMTGGLEAKKYSIYGRDQIGLFYCDQFPYDYMGVNPKLNIVRFLYQKKNPCQCDAGARWTKVNEQSNTTRDIWKVFCENGRKKPLARWNMNFKKNNDVSKYMNSNPYCNTKNKSSSVAMDYYVNGWFFKD